MQFHLQFENIETLQEEKFVEYKVVIFPGDFYSDSIPQITLASFQLDEEREYLLIKYLDKFSSTLTPLRISFQDAAFSEAVLALQAQLNMVLKIDVRVHKRHLMKMFGSQIDKSFNSAFPVEKLVLLKYNSDNYLEVCKEFSFF